MIFFAKRTGRPVRNVLLFALAGTAGFLVTYGYWGWLLWKNFESPFFPFFNSVFRSPYWEGPDYRDIRYFDKSWATVLFYPFYLFWNIDDRLPLQEHFELSNFRVLTAFVLCTVMPLIALRNGKKEKTEGKDVLVPLLTFWLVVVYVFWLYLFRVYRYMIPFDLMLSLLLVRFIFKNTELKSFHFPLFLFIYFTIHLIRHAIPPVKEYYQTVLIKQLFIIEAFLSVTGTVILLLAFLKLVKTFLAYRAESEKEMKKHKKEKEERRNKDKKHVRIFVSVLTVFIVWQFFFREYTSLVVFELLLAFALSFLIAKRTEIRYCNKRQLLVLLFSAFVLYKCVTFPPPRPYEKPLISTTRVSLRDDTLLILSGEAGALFVPFLAHNPTIRAVIDPKQTNMINGSTFHTNGYFARKRDELIEEHKKQGKQIAYLTREAINDSCELLSHVKINHKTAFQSYFILLYYVCQEENVRTEKTKKGTKRPFSSFRENNK